MIELEIEWADRWMWLLARAESYRHSPPMRWRFRGVIGTDARQPAGFVDAAYRWYRR